MAFLHDRQKSCFFKIKFYHSFSYENCAGCAIRKSHLAVLVVLVAFHKLQLAVRKKALKKSRIKMLMKSTPGVKSWLLIYPNLSTLLKTPLIHFCQSFIAKRSEMHDLSA
jgi:hypothetical protein